MSVNRDSSNIKTFLFKSRRRLRNVFKKFKLELSFLIFKKNFRRQNLGVSLHDSVIIVFASFSYLEIVLNWIRNIQSLGLDDYVIVSTDKRIYKSLKNIKIQTIYFRGDKSRSYFWEARVKVFRFLLESGHSFIHSDADAIWIRNPIQKYLESESGRKLDLIISEGTFHPTECLEKWGFVLCCGFFYVRSSQKAIDFFKEIERDVQDSGDDQVSLNRVLYRHNVIWDTKEKDQIHYRHAANQTDYQITISDATMRGTCTHLRVGVLPFRKFPRLAQEQDNPFVVHPLLPKGGHSKKRELQKLGLWVAE